MLSATDGVQRETQSSLRALMQASNWKQNKCTLETNVALFGKNFSLHLILDGNLEVRQYLDWTLLFLKQKLNLSI